MLAILSKSDDKKGVPASIYTPSMTWLERPVPIKKVRRSKPTRQKTRLSTTDGADAAEADRRLSDPKEQPIDYVLARKKLGLA